MKRHVHEDPPHVLLLAKCHVASVLGCECFLFADSAAVASMLPHLVHCSSRGKVATDHPQRRWLPGKLQTAALPSIYTLAAHSPRLWSSGSSEPQTATGPCQPGLRTTRQQAQMAGRHMMAPLASQHCHTPWQVAALPATHRYQYAGLPTRPCRRSCRICQHATLHAPCHASRAALCHCRQPRSVAGPRVLKSTPL
jgi:hypothetical protein